MSTYKSKLVEEAAARRKKREEKEEAKWLEVFKDTRPPLVHYPIPPRLDVEADKTLSPRARELSAKLADARVRDDVMAKEGQPAATASTRAPPCSKRPAARARGARRRGARGRGGSPRRPPRLPARRPRSLLSERMMSSACISIGVRAEPARAAGVVSGVESLARLREGASSSTSRSAASSVVVGVAPFASQ